MAILNPSWLGSGTTNYKYAGGHLVLMASTINESKNSEVGHIYVRSLCTGGRSTSNQNNVLTEYTGITFNFTGIMGSGATGGYSIWEIYEGQSPFLEWQSGTTDRLDSAFDSGFKEIYSETGAAGMSNKSFGVPEWNYKLSTQSSFTRDSGPLYDVTDISELAGAEFDFKGMTIPQLIVDNSIDYGVRFYTSGSKAGKLMRLFWITPFFEIE